LSILTCKASTSSYIPSHPIMFIVWSWLSQTHYQHVFSDFRLHWVVFSLFPLIAPLPLHLLLFIFFPSSTPLNSNPLRVSWPGWLLLHHSFSSAYGLRYHRWAPSPSFCRVLPLIRKGLSTVYTSQAIGATATCRMQRGHLRGQLPSKLIVVSNAHG
jgi:hypothetical protein